MENYTVSRRRFLGAALAAIPSMAVLPSLGRFLRLKEAEYSILCRDFPPVVVTTYSDGSLTALFGGAPCRLTPIGDWFKVEGKDGFSACEVKARRSSATELDVDYIALAQPNYTCFDDFGNFPASAVKFGDFLDMNERWRGLKLLG